jgi:probable HAF family extracellular repeat protein
MCQFFLKIPAYRGSRNTEAAKGGTMKSRSLALIIAVLVFTKLAAPIPLAAQEHPHYKLIDLGTFGGPQSYVYMPNNYAPVLNNQGTVAGWADTSIYPDPFSPYCFNPDCYVSNAFQSLNGTITDLGALSGGVSSAASWISSDGMIAGWSENGSIDHSFPVPGIPVTHAVLWKDSAITDLKTLKHGHQSVALAVNNRGQVVGAADNGKADSNAMSSDIYGWVTQTRAFLWQDDVMQDVGTLGGTDAVALLINDQGQIVGASYTSSAPSAYCGANFGASLTTGAFLYENGEMKNIGSFGGTCTFPTDLNDQGEIVGISTLPGDKYQHAFLWNGSLKDLHNNIGGHNAAAIGINDGGNAVGFASLSGDQYVHAALWKQGTMIDLGTVDGDPCSNAYSLNANDQVVGVSVPGCDFNQTRAVLWEDGSIADLNTLIPPDSPLYLTTPETINDRGEIAGVGLDSSGNQHAFLLIPCSLDDCACGDAAGYPAFRPTPNITRPSNYQNAIRRMVRRGSRPASEISPLGTSSVGSSGITEDTLVPDETVNKTVDALPSLSESLDAGAISRSETAPKCGHYGMPCSEPKVYDGCCPGLKCVFRGGSTRAGYACE